MPKPAKADNHAINPDGPDTYQPSRLVRVWDPFVRLFHWSLVTMFLVAYFTRHDSATIHHLAGYAAGALVLMRVVWGLLGTGYARFSEFVCHPRTVLNYLRDIASGREARHIGHNPAGGAMVLALMVLMLVTSTTGWMETTNAYFGVAWVTNLHADAAHGLLLLVFVHLCGVALASLRHRENLVRAMVTGDKREPESGDIA